MGEVGMDGRPLKEETGDGVVMVASDGPVRVGE
jgi:hypothetical protein